MERLNRYVSPAQIALEQAPEIFQPVSVDLSAHVLRRVVHDFMHERLFDAHITGGFSVDGSPVQPRRQVVDIAKCNGCHTSLSLHGENQNQIEMCVLCHNASENDV